MDSTRSLNHSNFGILAEEPHLLQLAFLYNDPAIWRLAMAKDTKKRAIVKPKAASKKKALAPTAGPRGTVHKDILAYNTAQTAGDKRICDTLCKSIHQNLPGAENKIWHRHPVWFLDGNPIVGYHKLKGPPPCIRLLFWSGRSFDEPGLAPEGGFQTAGARYTSADEIVAKDLKRWLKKSIDIQWDYKNIVKRKGRLERLK